MKWNRVDIKLGVTMLSIFLLVFALLGFVTDRVITKFYIQKSHEENMELAAHFLKMANTQHGINPDAITTMAEFSKVGIHVLDATGAIASRSSNMEQPLEQYLTPSMLQALQKGQSIDTEISTATGQGFIISGLPLMDGDIFQGSVIMTASLAPIVAFLHNIRQLLLILCTVGMVIGLAFSFVLSRKLTEPIQQMVTATRNIAIGHLDTRVTVSSKDEIGALAASINDMARDLERYQNTRSEFFANIPHDLKTPITYLEGYARVVAERLYENEEEEQQYLMIIHHEAKRLNRLINDLFELSKLEDGQIRLEPEALNLVPLMERVLSNVSLNAAQKGVELCLQTPASVIQIWGDEGRLEQILVNLLDNAIRYTDQGSITASIEPGTEQCRISIQDTGIGIPEAELPYLFDRLYRVEKSRSREHGGSGLGLSIVSKLIELHHGQIEVKSRYGQGACFMLTLPHRPH
ncbi:HAMP domain-containing sensor histidine kinase [Paenibacillus terrigena]|uniref:sensor histidine kinase n=1 Tax=Paenibacillus terrigena TaxID=369333 RepID=UPI0028D6FCB1|nr:HAMP domain-containing sensor histidine kinase [Paenibacillus terrigena]